MNLTTQQTFRGDGSAYMRPHGPEHYRQHRVQLHRSRLTGPQLWRLDHETPAFDPTYNVVSAVLSKLPKPFRSSGGSMHDFDEITSGQDLTPGLLIERDLMHVYTTVRGNYRAACSNCAGSNAYHPHEC